MSTVHTVVAESYLFLYASCISRLLQDPLPHSTYITSVADALFNDHIPELLSQLQMPRLPDQWRNTTRLFISNPTPENYLELTNRLGLLSQLDPSIFASTP
jgi:hypothetical protein